MKNYITIILVMSLGLTFGQELFRDNFTSKANAWSDLSEQGKVTIQNNVLTIDNSSGTTDYRTKLNIPIDWSKNFSIKTSLRLVSGTKNNMLGFLFSRQEEPSSGYSYGIADNGYFIFWKYDKGNKYNESSWQKSTVIQSGLYNTLEVQKIGATAYFLVNNQVVYKQEGIEKLGDDLALQICKGAKVAYEYVSISYLNSANNEVLEQELESYKAYGTHKNLMGLEEKVQALKSSSPYFTNTSKSSQLFFPENNEVYLSEGNYSMLYNLETKQAEKVFKSIYSKVSKDQFGDYVDLVTDFSTNQFVKFEDNRFLFSDFSGKGLQSFDNYDSKFSKKPGFFLGMLTKTKALIYNEDQFSSFDIKTTELEELYKLKLPKEWRYGSHYQLTADGNYLLLKKDNRLMVYNAKDGSLLIEDLGKNTPNFNGYEKLRGYFDGTIVIESINGDILLIEIAKKTISKLDHAFRDRIYLKDQYVYHVTGEGLEVYNAKEKKFLTKKPIIIPKLNESEYSFSACYYPKLNKVYVSSGINKNWYVSDSKMKFSAFLADISSGEITPLLFHESSTSEQKKQELKTTEDNANKAKVDALFAKLKPFGSYFKFNYSDFPYVSLYNDPILKKAYITNIKAIGKFCGSYGGGSILALRQTRSSSGVGEQYIFELIDVSSTGSVSRKTLGVTQKVRGNVTQLCDITVNKSGSGYTITSNTDGRIKKYTVGSNCK